MTKYLVRVSMVRTEEICVEGKDVDDATRAAVEVATFHNPGHVLLINHPILKSYSSPTLAPDDARPMTYTCAHCGRQSAKEAWGPGRITCPTCGLRAPTAGETTRRVSAPVDIGDGHD